MALSACMMVKDEEELLPGCLDSIKDIVNEIVIVDTGSTDRTVEIAETYGAKVFHHPWSGGFSEHRNQSFGYASNEWILCIDADERYEGSVNQNLEDLLAAMDEKDINFGLLNVISESMSGGQSRIRQVRLFRRGHVRWQGIVHNSSVTDGAGWATDLKIHHLGYNLSPEKALEKYRQREKLIRKALEDEPTAMMFQYLMRNLRAQGRFDEVVELYEEIDASDFELKPAVEQVVCMDAICSLIQIDRKPEAECLMKRLLTEYPNNLDGHYEYGNMLGAAGEYEEAIASYRNYLLLRERFENGLQTDMMNVDSWGSAFMAYFSIGISFLRLGKIPEALEALYIADMLDGDHDFITDAKRKALGRIVFDMGELVKYFPEIELGGK